MKKIATLLLATVLLSNSSLANTMSGTTVSPDDLKETTTEAVAINENMALVAATKHEEDSHLFYTIDVNYPQISGTNLSAGAQEFNRLINNMVNNGVQQFKNYVKTDLPHMPTLPNEVKQNKFTMNYDIDVIKPNNQILISTRLSIEGMQAGHAHPYHAFQVLNFDLNTGKEVVLKNLFKPNINYLKIFSAYASKELNNKLPDKWMISAGTAPIAKNYQLWNLEDDGILITFPEYQVAPYAYGEQEVEIPYTVLKNIVDPKAPIATCTLQATGCTVEK